MSQTHLNTSYGVGDALSYVSKLQSIFSFQAACVYVVRSVRELSVDVSSLSYCRAGWQPAPDQRSEVWCESRKSLAGEHRVINLPTESVSAPDSFPQTHKNKCVPVCVCVWRNLRVRGSLEAGHGINKDISVCSSFSLDVFVTFPNPLSSAEREVRARHVWRLRMRSR